ISTPLKEAGFPLVLSLSTGSYHHCNDQPSFCPSHWVPYGGNCYYLVRDKKMWRDALAACHREGGDLASIHNIEEQSFIISQTGYCKYVLWIGLNDQRNQLLFEWSDHSHVTFTQWLTGEPSHLESCVDINSDSGKWSTNSCSRYRSYICKIPKGMFNQL
uniref:C-type lectin domain-containing protein n=1 Tax=Monopterus albus TaxID=43700 RepID=A0A3Q3KI24_MONAL